MGIPQGSPLSPILFIIFTIDLITTSEDGSLIKLLKYADDLILIIDNYNLNEAINSYMDNITEEDEIALNLDLITDEYEKKFVIIKHHIEVMLHKIVNGV